MDEDKNRITKIWYELKRRKVVGVIIVYATVAFILMQLANLFESSLNLPQWFDTVITIALIIGFPVAIIFSWIFDISSKGITKTEPGKAPTAVTEKPVPEKSIIVLPFENISSDPEQDYFSDGLTEEIITDLSYIKDLLVISRSSAMTFKGTKQTIKEISEKVNVRYVLEGSIRKSENNLKIVAQLIDAENDSHIWAEKYTGKLDDIFDIQEKVSGSIASALKFELSPELKRHIKIHPVNDIDANDYYIKARQNITSWSEDKLNMALISIQNALDLEGENPYLLSLKGLAHFQYVNMGIKQKEHIVLATELANRALKLDPDSADANFTLGLIDILNGKVRDAVSKIEKALSIDPTNSDYLIWCAWFYMILGKPESAKFQLNKVLKSDPLNQNIDIIEGPIACFEGQFESAAEICTRAYENQPDNLLLLLFSSLSLAYAGKTEDAIDQIDKSLSKKDQKYLAQLCRFLKCSLKKDLAGISKLLTDDFRETTKRDGQVSYHVACFYSYLGQTGMAMEWLENAVEREFFNYPLMNEIDPFLKNIRGEKRFQKLMKKVKPVWEEIEG